MEKAQNGVKPSLKVMRQISSWTAMAGRDMPRGTLKFTKGSRKEPKAADRLLHLPGKTTV